MSPFETFPIPEAEAFVDQATERLQLQRDAMQPVIDSLADAIGNGLADQQKQLNGVVNGLKRQVNGAVKEQAQLFAPVLDSLESATQSAIGEQQIQLNQVSLGEGGGIAAGTAAPTTPFSYLSIQPGSGPAGTLVELYVGLIEPAPVGGALITVDPIAPPLPFPAEILIPEGLTDGYATAVAGMVPSTTTLPITVVYNGFAQLSQFTITVPVIPPPAPSLVSLTFNPSSVQGGQSATGTVTLSGPAPSGGATVLLAAGSAVVTVPVSIMVPAGATQQTFAAGTSVVSVQQVVTVTASCPTGGPNPPCTGSVLGSLTVTPAPPAPTLYTVYPCSSPPPPFKCVPQGTPQPPSTGPSIASGLTLAQVQAQYPGCDTANCASPPPPTPCTVQCPAPVINLSCPQPTGATTLDLRQLLIQLGPILPQQDRSRLQQILQTVGSFPIQVQFPLTPTEIPTGIIQPSNGFRPLPAREVEEPPTPAPTEVAGEQLELVDDSGLVEYYLPDRRPD